MIRFLKHSEIDKSLWDKCIHSSQQNVIYSHSWFLDVVCPNWDALIENNYTSVFPLPTNKKAGINYLYQPHFTQQLGLFGKNLSPEKVSEFLQNIPEKFRLIEIQLNYFCKLKENTFPGFNIKERITHHLNLLSKTEKISALYSDNLRRNIKKFNSGSFTISEKVSVEEIIYVFRETKGKEVKTLKQKNYEILKQLYEEAEKRNLLIKYGVYNANNKLISGAVFLHSPLSYIFHFSATAEEGRNTGSLAAIINYFIQKHSGEKMILDFEGSMDAGLARFYKGFGSKEIVYLQTLRNNLPLPFRWLK